MSERISERDLILPSLFCMSQSNNNTISTSTLINRLRDLLQPIGEDLEILSGRNDDKFSQKVRNLRSHGTLEETGYCTYDDGQWTLTEEGVEYLSLEPIIQYLLESGFDFNDIQTPLNLTPITTKPRTQTVILFDETATVDEGIERNAKRRTYTRSNKLRQHAIMQLCNYSLRKRWQTYL